MAAFKCDICGCYFDSSNRKGIQLVPSGMRYTGIILRNSSHSMPIDTCNECIAKIGNFIKSNGKTIYPVSFEDEK